MEKWLCCNCTSNFDLNKSCDLTYACMLTPEPQFDLISTASNEDEQKSTDEHKHEHYYVIKGGFRHPRCKKQGRKCSPTVSFIFPIIMHWCMSLKKSLKQFHILYHISTCFLQVSLVHILFHRLFPINGLGLPLPPTDIIEYVRLHVLMELHRSREILFLNIV